MSNNQVTNRLILETMNRSFDGIEKRFDKVDIKLDKHNIRITSLEKFKEKVMFSWAVVVGLATVGYDYAKHKILKTE